MEVCLLDNKLVVVRGGGDIASGIIHRLHRSGFKVVILEIDSPTVIRRTVSFAQAVYDNVKVVEGVKAVKVDSIDEVRAVLDKNEISLLIDRLGTSIKELKPYVVIDAILAKRNLGTKLDLAPIVIGVGSGFIAGEDVHAVIESKRGHNLGKVILEGSAEPNTGIPGDIEGFSHERVVKSHKEGIVKHKAHIGDIVSKGEVIGYIDDTRIISPIDGVLRGFIQEGLKVPKNYKIGDVDPRKEIDYCFSISDKARAIGGAILEAILYLSSK